MEANEMHVMKKKAKDLCVKASSCKIYTRGKECLQIY